MFENSEQISQTNLNYQIKLQIYAFVGAGHATSVFCKLSVRRSKYCLEFSDYLRMA